ncbi:uncharacterized protein LOC141802548 [Halichoeres trimaculatus]|uniref:uncharacterized protein LOC141802548 n=1 Tax=Halichoeres trimaculatus TaxID=147232 RepID=UPI003D9E2A47
MSKVQTVRGLIIQRLSLAAEEIFELFERTIAEYEEQLCRSKEENQRQQKLLEAVYNPEVRLHRADVQPLSVMKEDVPPEHQERSPRLDQELPPHPPNIKEEEKEELWSSQERQQLQGQKEKEEEISALIFPPVHVKSEGGEEKAQSSQLRENQTEVSRDVDGEDGGGSATQEKTLRSSECDSGESSFVCMEVRMPPSGLNPLQNNQVHLSERQGDAGKTSMSPLEYALSFGRLEQLQQKHTLMEIEEKPFSCSFCGKRFSTKKYLQKHTIRHTEERRFSCSVCEKTFLWRVELVRHMRSHMIKKPFTCHICGLFFKKYSMLAYHLKQHADTDQFTCTVCHARFSHREAWDKHMEGHQGEAPFSCLTCGKMFSERGSLMRHVCFSKSSQGT